MFSTRFSLIAAALAGVLTLASAAGSFLLAAGVALVQVVFAMGVVRSSELPSVRPAAWFGLAAGLGTLVWVDNDGTPDLTPVAAVLGATLLVAFIIQLTRRDGRPGLRTALSLVVTACVFTTLPVMWVALRATGEGVYTVGLALLGVGAVGLAEGLPISWALRRVLGVVTASTGAAVLVITVDGLGQAVPAVSAVVIAAFAGVMAAATFAVADRLAGEVSPEEIPVLVTVPDESSSQAGPGGGIEASGEAVTVPAPANDRRGMERGADPDGSAVGVPSIASLRIAGPFIAAAPAAYVLGQLLVS